MVERPSAESAEERRQNARLAETYARERTRLWRFVRARVREPTDAEDILQDVFYELVLAYRLAKPIEHLGAWLFRVARNRIIDRFRKRGRAGPSSGESVSPSLIDLLPSPDAGPDAAYARSVIMAELEDALAELPAAQREVFIAHELEGEPFTAIAARTGAGVNTLLSRKRYAVLHLRRRLRTIHDDIVGGEAGP